MKLLSLPTLLAAALFSIVVTIPFAPVSRISSSFFGLEVRMSSTAEGQAQVYFNTGAGYSEVASSRVLVSASAEPTTYRLPLPRGTLHSLRFDPIDRSGQVVIESLRIVGESGREHHAITLADLQLIQQIERLPSADTRLVLAIHPGADDPQSELRFSPPLELDVSAGQIAWDIALPALAVLIGVLVLILAISRIGSARRGGRSLATWAATRPAAAVCAASLLAAVSSSYPVVFLGRSLVSPNSGASLLYERFPTLPGYRDGNVVRAQGADVGAIMWQHVQYSAIQHRALAQGELPLWNRYNSAGTPLLGQGQSMGGDLLHNLLAVLTNSRAWAWDLKFLLAKWLLGAGLGLLVLRLAAPTGSSIPRADATSSSSASLLPALTVAFAAPFIGFFIFRINHPAVFSLCYAPWALYTWVRAVQAQSLRATFGWSAALMLANWQLMNSGTAKEAYMLLLTMNLAGCFVLAAERLTWRDRLGKLAVLSWTGVLFALISAPVWSTFLRTLSHAYTSYNAVSAFQIQPSIILGLFDEVFYRPLTPSQWVFNPSLNFLFLLGLLYFLATLRSHFGNRAVMALALASLVPLAFAFGLLPASWLITIPFLSNVAHLDNSFSCGLIVLWSVLAGVGFTAAAKRLGTRKGAGDLAICGLLLGALVFAWIAFRQADHRSIYAIGPTFSPLRAGQPIPVTAFVWGSLVALLSSSVVLGWVLHRAAARRSHPAAAAILVAVCLAPMLWRFALHAPSVGFQDYVVVPGVRADLHANSPAVQTLRRLTAKEPARVYGLNGNLFGGWSGMYGLETIYGPDALANPNFRELAQALSGVQLLWDWRLYLQPTKVAEARRQLDALNVRYYADLKSDQGLLGRSLRLVATGDLDVYESPTAWPRAFFTNRVHSYVTAADFVHAVDKSEGRPLAAAQMSDSAAQAAFRGLETDLEGRIVTPATNYRLTENSTSFRIHAREPGAVVLSETHWPGDFRAWVNGRKVPVLRLNHAFKGVAIDEAGDYEIEFRYVPKGWYRNLALCGTGLLLLAATSVLALRPRLLRARKEPHHVEAAARVG